MHVRRKRLKCHDAVRYNMTRYAIFAYAQKLLAIARSHLNLSHGTKKRKSKEKN